MKFYFNLLVIISIIIAIVIILLSLKKVTFKNKDLEYNLYENEFNENQKMSLEMALKLVSEFNPEKKQIVNGNDYRYNRFTIDKTLRKEVNDLLKPIICKIDDLLKTNYKIVELESVEKTINKEKTEILYKIEFFIVELDETRSNKLYAEIHFDIYTKNVTINEIVLNNCNLSQTNCYLENIPKNTNENISFSIHDAKKIVYDLDKIKKHDREHFSVNGIYKTNLEQGIFSSKVQSKPQKAVEHNKWIIPENVKNSKKNAWPCKHTPHIWGKYGITKNRKSTKDCYGDNLATVKRNLVNNFTPDHGVLFRNEGEIRIYSNLLQINIPIGIKIT